MIEITGDFGSSVFLTPLPIEGRAQEPRVRRMRRQLENEARLRGDGAIVWEDSGSIVPPKILREDARVEMPESHTEAYKRHVKSSNRHAQEPSPEQRFEMRSAFGEGKNVINAVTGEKYET